MFKFLKNMKRTKKRSDDSATRFGAYSHEHAGFVVSDAQVLQAFGRDMESYRETRKAIADAASGKDPTH